MAHIFHQEAAQDGARQLSDPVEGCLDQADLSCDQEGEGDCRVQVSACRAGLCQLGRMRQVAGAATI